eukprot:3771448-Rhodomonas_salina.2
MRTEGYVVMSRSLAKCDSSSSPGRALTSSNSSSRKRDRSAFKENGLADIVKACSGSAKQGGLIVGGGSAGVSAGESAVDAGKVELISEVQEEF